MTTTHDATNYQWLRVDGTAIPEELKEREQWVCWRALPGEPGKKPRKVPYDPVNRRKAKANDSTTWHWWGDCWHPYLRRLPYFAGVGYEFSDDDPYTGIDLDKCRDPETGAIHPAALEVLASIKSYAEISPSGTGVKLIVRGKLPDDIRHKAALDGIEFEVYDRERYFALTGHVVDDEHGRIIDAQDALDGIVARIQAGTEAKATRKPETAARSDDDVFRRAVKRAISIRYADENDGSRRLLKVAIIATEMDLSETDAIRLVSEVHRLAPFPSEFSEADILRRLRDAETKTTRGKSLKQESPRTAARFSANPQDDLHLTDLGNCRRLVKHHGDDFRFCHPWNAALTYCGTHWEQDKTAEMERKAKATVRQLWMDAAKCDDPEERKAMLEFATSSERAERIRAMISLARSEPGVPVLPEQLDQDPWVLCCPNGTVDLRTGQLRPHRREDFITKLCPTRFNPDANSYHWDRFIDSIFDGKQSLIDFTRRLFGYCLTGSTVEQILAIAHGSGSNGKSTLLEALMHTLGEGYAMQAVSDLLMVKQQESHPTERSDLRGMRLVCCVETGDGKSLNEPLVKQLTGSDRVRARKLYQDFFEFRPTHKVILCTNHKPQIRGSDHAIWRRLILLPFAVRFWDAAKGETGPTELAMDKTLPAKLEAEAEGILAWLVRGCLEWQQDGLQVPAEVRDATGGYRAEQDRIGQFIDECCITGTAVRVRANALYADYRCWSERRGEHPVSQTRFGEAITERGIEKRASNGVWYIGIATRASESCGMEHPEHTEDFSRN